MSPLLGRAALAGPIVMAVTPFYGAGVDERSFAELAAWQVDAGSSGLCVAGPAGEAPPWRRGSASA
ncbi:hypothetical protein [Enterovirga sp. CN4-39]|uniref:hypothetical protein n=1 Tax=Enterovirga sp. CN4-39 TaxID=3400910 RepID=UPI003BFE6EEE